MLTTFLQSLANTPTFPDRALSHELLQLVLKGMKFEAPSPIPELALSALRFSHNPHAAALLREGMEIEVNDRANSLHIHLYLELLQNRLIPPEGISDDFLSFHTHPTFLGTVAFSHPDEQILHITLRIANQSADPELAQAARHSLTHWHSTPLTQSNISKLKMALSHGPHPSLTSLEDIDHSGEAVIRHLPNDAFEFFMEHASSFDNRVQARFTYFLIQSSLRNQNQNHWRKALEMMSRDLWSGNPPLINWAAKNLSDLNFAPSLFEEGSGPALLVIPHSWIPDLKDHFEALLYLEKENLPGVNMGIVRNCLDQIDADFD